MQSQNTPSDNLWDAFVAAQPRAHILQLSGWGTLKGEFGWQAERVTLSDAGGIVGGAQLLFRRLPFRLGTMAYLAMGPYLRPDAGSGQTAALWQAIHQAARRRRAAFLKWEPGLFLPGDPRPDCAALGFRPSSQTVQPPRTILLDISADDETILARMNQGTRRKIRQSQKHGVRCYPAARDDVAAFNALLQTTGARNAFGVHEPRYYERAYELFVPRQAALILAEHEGDKLAGIMVFALGRTAWYFYGASSDLKRNLMATYGVQWAAIQWAKSRGCRFYDLWGIPDADEAALEAEFERRSDGLWGVYGFKRGWGGQVVRAAAAWDYVYNPAVYAAYRLALAVRAHG